MVRATLTVRPVWSVTMRAVTAPGAKHESPGPAPSPTVRFPMVQTCPFVTLFATKNKSSADLFNECGATVCSTLSREECAAGQRRMHAMASPDTQAGLLTRGAVATLLCLPTLDDDS
jgi:hypothetical protein